MPSISYQKVDLAPGRLRELKRAIEQAPSDRKIGAYNKWLHYANLNNWRDQGLHFRYLTGYGKGAEPQYYCTCGLIVDFNGEGASEISTSNGLKLDEVQRFRGHRSLPSGDGLVVAFIMDSKHDWAFNRKRWQVLCQGCGEHRDRLLPADSAEFVALHNRECGGSCL